MLNLAFDKILFLDIETVPLVGEFDALREDMQHLWEEKFDTLLKRQPERYEVYTPAQGFEQTAGLFAEYGRIVCISVGFCYMKDGERYFRTKSFAGTDESKLLSDFTDLVAHFFTTPNHTFCGHNIKEFDIPYICRRLIINGLKLPRELQIAGKKPWEINFIDTLDLWKFGDFKSYTSLKTLAAVLDVPTPKDDIDGSEVARVYYEEKNIERIATYCQKDVVATAQVLFRLCGKPIIEPSYVENIS